MQPVQRHWPDPPEAVVNLRILALSGTVIGCMYDVNAIPRPVGFADAGAPETTPDGLSPDLTELPEAGPEPPDAPTEAGSDLEPDATSDTSGDTGSEFSPDLGKEPVEAIEVSPEVGDSSPEVVGTPCGGPAVIKCAASYYCDLPAGMCGVTKLWGFCVPIPGALGTCADMVRADVCNCDGTTVRNDCIRILLGLQKAHDGPC